MLHELILKDKVNTTQSRERDMARNDATSFASQIDAELKECDLPPWYRQDSGNRPGRSAGAE